MELFQTSASSVFSLATITLIGLFIRKKNYVSERAAGDISWIVLNVALPGLIVASFQRQEYRPSQLRDIFLVLILFFVMHLVSGLAGLLLAKMLPGSKKEKNLIIFSQLFANVAFMGFPLLKAMFGDSILMYASLVNVQFNVFLFTIGIYLMEPKSKISIKKVFSSSTVAIIFALVLYFFHIYLPKPISAVFFIVAEMTTPLAMLVIGFSLATVKFAQTLKDCRLYIFSFVKLIFIPCAVYVILSFFPIPQDILSVVVIMSGVPTASSATIFAIQYKSDSEFASKLVFVSTLFSIATLPLIATLAAANPLG